MGTRESSARSGSDRGAIGRRSVALLLAGGVLAAAIVVPAAAAPTVTPGDRIKVWTTNIKGLLYKDQRFYDRTFQEEYKPDIIAVQEVRDDPNGDYTPREKFVDRLNATYAGTGADFRAGHSSDVVTDHSNSTNMLVWRRARFTHLGTHATPSYQDCIGATGSPLGEMTTVVKLRDERENKIVIAASVHFRAATARQCMDVNLEHLDTFIRTRFPERHMVIIAGDFNAHPHQQLSCSGGACEDEFDVTPDCWYRDFAAHRTDNCTPGLHDAYYDTVRLKATHAATGNGSQQDICQQGTHQANGNTGPGTPCTDTDRNGERDRSRIDYIWTQWLTYNATTNLSTPSPYSGAEATQRIGHAFTDKACSDVATCGEDGLYSDHRAVTAMIKWRP